MYGSTLWALEYNFHVEFNMVLTNVKLTRGNFIPNNFYFVSNHRVAYNNLVTYTNHTKVEKI